MPVVPGRLDQDASQLGVAGPRNSAAPDAPPTGVFGGHESRKGHDSPGRREASRVAEFHGEHEGAEGIDAAEAAQAGDPLLEGGLGDERVEVRFDVVETAPGFIDGAEIVRMGVRERRQLPPLGAEPLVHTWRPRTSCG